jgi:hypothetical protein
VLPDPFEWVEIFQSKAQHASDPSHVLMLRCLQTRLLCEMARDLDGVLKTLAPEFELLTLPEGVGDTIAGHAGMIAMLERIWASDGTAWMQVGTLLVDDSSLAAEGVLHYVGSGTELERSFGRRVVVSDAYHFTTRFSMFDAFRDGLVHDEITFIDPDGRTTPVNAEEHADFKRRLDDGLRRFDRGGA